MGGPTLLCVGDPNIQYNWGRQTREGRLELSQKFMSFGGATRPFVKWLVTCSFETSLTKWDMLSANFWLKQNHLLTIESMALTSLQAEARVDIQRAAGALH